MNKPAAAAVAQALNAETIRNQQQEILRLKSVIAVALNRANSIADNYTDWTWTTFEQHIEALIDGLKS